LKEEVMHDPQERAGDTRIRETGLIPPDSFEQSSLESLPDAPPPYVKEPLFNKKVMAVWALGALAVWFAFSIIVPIVVESTRSSIREAVKEAATNSDGTITIKRSRDGKVYTITREPTPTVRATPDAKAAPPVAVPAPGQVAPLPDVVPPAKAPPAKR
jgi:hypothetical protein